MSTNQDTIPADTMIAEFRVESLLGRGAMAAVYKAVQVSLDRPIALKVLPKEFTSDSDFVERFFNEARSAAALSHINIVQAYDAGITDDAICYFAMEFVEGESLLERVERDGPLKLAMALQIMTDIAQALDYGWKRQKLTHGDIKPANILVNDRGIPKLADFGLAKIAEFEFEGDGIMLTPLYAAPEIIQGQIEHENCASDIYSFGATLYHLLVGEPPFPGEDPEVVMKRQVNEPLTAAIDKNPKIPRKISRWLDELLDKNPANRPNSWSVVVPKIEALLQACAATANAEDGKIKNASIQSPKRHRNVPNPMLMLTRKRHKKHTMRLVIALVLLVLANALALWLLLKNKEPSDNELPEDTMEVEAVEPITHEEPSTEILDSEAQPPPAPVDTAHEDAVKKRFQQMVDENSDTAFVDYTETITPTLPHVDDLEHYDHDQPATPLTDEQQQKIGDDYTEFIHRIGEFSYAPPFNLEPLIVLCNEWIDTHPGQTHETQKVRFLLDQILPNLDRLTATLIANGNQLIGVKLPDFDQQTIAALTPDGIQMRMRLDDHDSTSTGEIKHVISWNELRHPKYFYTLCRYLVEDTSVALDDKLPCLAFMTLVRAQKPVDEAIQRLSSVPQRMLWREIAGDLAMAPRNHMALNIWRECRKTAETGELRKTYVLIEKLESHPSEILRRYEDEIQSLKEHCANSVPKVQASRLVQKALDCLDSDPTRSLNLIGVAEARYGKIDFPERIGVDGIRKRAVQRLITTDNPEKYKEISSFWHCIPFALNVSHPREVPTLARWSATLTNPETPKPMQQFDAVYTGLGLMETGAWSTVRQSLMSQSRETLMLPLHHQAVIEFANALIDHRYNSTDMAPTINDIIQLKTQASTKLGENIIELVALKLALLSNTEPLDPSHWQSIDALSPEHNQYFVKPLLICLLAHFVEHGELQRFSDSVRKLNQTKIKDLSGFGQSEIFAIESVVEYLFSTDSTDIVFPHHESVTLGRDAYTRLLLAAIVAHPLHDRHLKRRQIAMLAPHCGTETLLATDTWFRILLFQLAQDIVNDHPDDAIVRIHNALNEQSPNTVAYYPRLQLLEAGMQLLESHPRVARECLQIIMGSTIASQRELALAKTFISIDQPLTDDSIPQDYWGAFLNTTRSMAQAKTTPALTQVDVMTQHAANAAEKELAEALKDYVLRQQSDSHSATP